MLDDLRRFLDILMKVGLISMCAMMTGIVYWKLRTKIPEHMETLYKILFILASVFLSALTIFIYQKFFQI